MKSMERPPGYSPGAEGDTTEHDQVRKSLIFPISARIIIILHACFTSCIYFADNPEMHACYRQGNKGSSGDG